MTWTQDDLLDALSLGREGALEKLLVARKEDAQIEWERHEGMIDVICATGALAGGLEDELYMDWARFDPTSCWLGERWADGVRPYGAKREEGIALLVELREKFGFKGPVVL